MFFERFRDATARLPTGLLRPGPAADPEAIVAVERALGVALPADYASFLRSFDGADLFHETIVLAGVGPGALLSLLALNAPARGADPDLAFAETASGDRFVFSSAGAPAGDEPAVIRVRGGSEERLRAGSRFSCWLDATIAREQTLYGPDGEFAPEVFDADGEEVVPRIALRQAERALRHDPGSAEAQLERGVALRRLGRAAEATEAFERATELDPLNPWLWFDLGRSALDDDPRRAARAFCRAADADAGPSGARMLAWATHAARAAHDDPAAVETRAAALARQPGLLDDLRRAVAAAINEGDAEAAAQATLLVDAMDSSAPAVRLRLPVLGEPKASDVAPGLASGLSSRAPPARPRPPGRPRRPGRAGPPPRGGSPRGPRR